MSETLLCWIGFFIGVNSLVPEISNECSTGSNIGALGSFIAKRDYIEQFRFRIGVDVQARLSKILTSSLLVDTDDAKRFTVHEAVLYLQRLNPSLKRLEISIEIVEDRLKFSRVVFLVPLVPSLVLIGRSQFPHGLYRVGIKSLGRIWFAA